MKTYDCDKCYAQTESEEDLHLTEHIGCGGTWIWDDGFSMTEPQPIRINAERIAQLEAQLAAAKEAFSEFDKSKWQFTTGDGTQAYQKLFDALSK